MVSTVRFHRAVRGSIPRVGVSFFHFQPPPVIGADPFRTSTFVLACVLIPITFCTSNCAGPFNSHIYAHAGGLDVNVY
jgi:hypothetical protein